MLSSLFQRSDSREPPLRIGLLLDSVELPSCFAEVVDHILQSNFARLELLVFNTEEQSKAAELPRRRPLFTKVGDQLSDPHKRKTFLFNLYQRWDRRNIVAARDPHALVNCAARFEGVESIAVTPIRKRFVHRFPPDAIEQIGEKQLDVLIRFGFNILRGEILTSAKYGVWSYHHGDGDYYRGGPAHFWELYEGNPLSGAMLQVLTEELDGGKVLCKGLFATYPGFSQVRNFVQPYWGASTFVIQKLRELHQYGWSHIERTALPPAPYLGRKKIYTTPSNWEMLTWLGPMLVRKSLQRLVRRSTIKHWRMAVRAGTPSIVHSGTSLNMSGFRWIEAPTGRFYADPFLFEHAERAWLFFEDFDYAVQRGRISCAELREDGIGPAVPVLETHYHLSYPCVFRINGDIYMIPESGANETVELYRCIHFPDSWTVEKVLFRGRAVDTTLWMEHGLYWFFVTLQERRGLGTQLWLFSATSLTGEWSSHPANPISTDVRNSRGAGAIFRHDGKLFRPSQDCGKHYGYSCTLNEIVALDRERYQEKPLLTIEPTWAQGLVGTHTYGCTGKFEVIDGCIPVPAAAVLERGAHKH